MKTLTRGQKAVLAAATLPMIGAGGLGAWGTYANITSVFHRKATAAGVVAAGEGATLVLALVLVGLTMLGQASPRAVRAGLWLLPMAASVTGAIVAPGARDAVVFAVTPMAMTVSAEGLGLLARRIVVYSTGVDMEVQRRNAVTLRRIAYHQARAARHPWGWVQKWSQLTAWRLLGKVGEEDTALGSGLVEVQRERLTEGADTALATMLGSPSAQPVLPPAEPAAHEPEPGSDREPGFETTVQTALTVAAPEPTLTALPLPVLPVDQQGSREPVLSPAEPVTVSPAEPSPEPESDQADQIEQQIVTLASRLRCGEQLTKTTAAQLLGVSQATAGRRLKDARVRISDGTGQYL
ncbi:hypothetical protein [Streptomyces sp. NPDC090798]|uniref:hypothetical protein n=1 Tax=Streptomyces sp. NPDC090798 TaxID=3365968 RepID=UPI003823F16D